MSVQFTARCHNNAIAKSVARKGKTTTTIITIFFIVRERMKTSALFTPLKKVEQK
jgi:hypothetical protein